MSFSYKYLHLRANSANGPSAASVARKLGYITPYPTYLAVQAIYQVPSIYAEHKCYQRDKNNDKALQLIKSDKKVKTLIYKEL